MRLDRIVILSALALPGSLGAQADSVTPDSAFVRRFGDRSILTERLFRTFMNDSPEHVFGLVPGVVLRGTETGLASASVLSIRGGTPGQASVYIDGAPVRFAGVGLRSIGLGSVSVANAALATGTPDLGLTDFNDGVIQYTTRSGGERFAGTLSARTDQAFEGVGYTRFEGTLGGPLPVAAATWFVGVTVAGQQSHYVGLGSADVPSFITGGTDTVVTRVVGTQTDSVALPLFIDQRAYDWGSELRAHARVDFPLSSKSKISVTAIANDVQERFFPENDALAPSLFTGARTTARAVVLDWRQHLGNLGGRPLALRINASLVSTREQGGLLDTASEAASRDPSLGISFETLRFTGADSIPFPLTDQMVRNIRTNSGMRVPYLNHDEFRNTQESRGNPYGMEASWLDAGLDGILRMASEQRAEGRWALDWEAAPTHTVTLGGSFSKIDLSNYTANLLRQSFMELYKSDPGRIGVYVADRFAIGSMRGTASVRYDHFGSAGLFADVPGRIYTNPQFNLPGAIGSDTAYFNSLERVMTPGKERDALSWQVNAATAVSSRAVLRGGLGQWVEPPAFGLVLMGSNSDLDFTNTNDVFGRDLDYGHASLAEIGARLEFSEALVADVAVYYRNAPRYVARIQAFNDPANPGDVVNVNTLRTVDDVVTWGPEIALDWRLGSAVTSRVVYTMSNGDTYATHAFTVGAAARAPDGVLLGLEAALLWRTTNGLPYTQLSPASGTGITALQTNFGALVGIVEPTNWSRLPWNSFLDFRLAKAMKLGAVELTGYADFRNVLNLTNVLDFYAETGDVENDRFRDNVLDVEYQNLEREAADNGRLLPNGDIDLIPNCASWTVTGGTNGAVVNCVALQRVEARFGNGDGLYSLAERQSALNAYFNAFYGPQVFYGAGRTVRLGVELRW